MICSGPSTSSLYFLFLTFCCLSGERYPSVRFLVGDLDLLLLLAGVFFRSRIFYLRYCASDLALAAETELLLDLMHSQYFSAERFM